MKNESRLILLFICVSFLFACNSQKIYITSNRSFIKTTSPIPYYGLKHYMYMDELNSRITDSVFMEHYYKRIDKKSIRCYECIDLVAEIYMLKWYTLKADEGFQVINRRVSKLFLDQTIERPVVLEYYLNNRRVSSKEEVFKVVTLKFKDINNIICDVSELKDSCKVNIVLKY